MNRPTTLREAVEAADSILIGAGAGLSAADGDHHSGPIFDARFADFRAQRGITDAYSGGFYPFPTSEERWAFWSRMISLLRYEADPGQVYADLLGLVGERDYFIITTNVDHRFQASGFDKERLFYTQGDYGLLQCSVPCHDATYDNEKWVREAVASQEGMRIPSELIPRCPRCGEEMTTNLRVDARFVQGEGWAAAAGRYEDFLERTCAGRVLYLELGVGMNTPSIIKFPFWRRVHDNPEATYACVALDAAAPAEIVDRSLLIQGDIAEALASARNEPRPRPFTFERARRIFRNVEAMMESRKMLKTIAPTLGDTSVATRPPPTPTSPERKPAPTPVAMTRRMRRRVSG